MKIAHVITVSGPLLALKMGDDLVDIGAYLRARSTEDPKAAVALLLLEEGMRLGEPALAVGLHRDEFSAALAGLLSGAFQPYLVKGHVTYLPPVSRPEKIIAVGRNYLAHAKEGFGRVPKEVLFFCKAPSCLTGCGEEVRAPEWAGRIDPEGELAVVMGKSGRYITKDKAMDYVLGYSIMNDVTARDMQHDDMKAGEPWFRSKSFDTFGPMGPYLATTDDVPDPHSLDVRTLVNGEVRQSDNTSSLMFKIPDIIAHVSKFMTLKAGDVIATGTPEGMKPIFPGDTVEITITGLGTLTNRLVRE